VPAFRPYGAVLLEGVLMRSLKLLIVDVLLVVIGIFLAQALRDNFEFVATNVSGLIPYVIASIISSIVVVTGLGLNRSVWRFSSMRDYLILAAAAAVIVVSSLLLTFSLNRLEGTARSIPFLSFLTILVLLVGARVYARIHYSTRRGGAKQFATEAADGDLLTKNSTIIIGLNRLTELYLQAAHEMGHGKPRIAGLIGRNTGHTGRLMHRFPVLGEPEQLPEIIRQLRVHGVVIDRIVVSVAPSALSSDARALLRELEVTLGVEVNYIALSLGLQSDLSIESENSRGTLEGEEAVQQLQVSAAERTLLSARPYWPVKRIVDLSGALLFLTILAPVIAVAALLVRIDIGRPVLFWQQRPGLGGRAFRVFKFRTMRPAFDGNGEPLPDSERVSALGTFLRRCRFDELPQLANILVGEMSFIGPRPLLPVDQPMGISARLLVRPGLTGWAQVKGGRHLTPADKVALDIWYVRNASLLVDAEIIWQTVLLVVRGEREDRKAVQQAWADIEKHNAAFRVSSSARPVAVEQTMVANDSCRTSLAS
jgi:lipopolysaccharide/colanic/teichoic acid biosynthesis glycosyltransferase